jgi:type I site-specific restriction endonuclease
VASAAEVQAWFASWQGVVVTLTTAMGGIVTAVGKMMLYQRQVRNEYLALQKQVSPVDPAEPPTREVIDNTKTDVGTLQHELEEHIETQKSNHDANEHRLDAIETRLEGVEKNGDITNTRLEQIGDDMIDVRSNLTQIRKVLDTMSAAGGRR